MKYLDTVVPYPTPKIARIKDSKLGLLRYALMFLIMVYVVGYQIMWRGNHLETQDLAGVYQLQLDHPTRNYCDPIDVECMQNFTSMSALPYCSQSPEAGPIKLPCKYFDAQQLWQLTDQGMMIPTHMSTFYQTRGCVPSIDNDWSCVGWLYDFLDKNGQVQEKRGQASPISDIFIADLERYTLLIDHSARAGGGTRSYASDMVGYWLDCNTDDDADTGCVPRPISCGHESCLDKTYSLPETRGAESRPTFRGDRRSLSFVQTGSKVKSKRRKESRASEQMAPGESHDDSDAMAALQLEKGEDLLQSRGLQSSRADNETEPEATEPDGHKVPARVNNLGSLGAVSLLQGDIFTIGMLLRAANVSLDNRRHNVPSWVGGSYRSSGFVLVIRIHYTNIESWLGLKVLPWIPSGPTMHYTYRITKHASHDDFMLKHVRPGGKGEPKNSRVVTEYNGIRVLIEQSGSVAVWDNIQLLLILTTTLALMAVATCITDCVALNCMPESAAYHAVKFERPRSEKKAMAKPQRRASSADIDRSVEEPDEERADDSVMRYSSITM